MIILRNKEFSDSRKKEKAIEAAGIIGGSALAGHNAGAVKGFYDGFKNETAKQLKSMPEYEKYVDHDRKTAKEILKIGKEAKKTADNISVKDASGISGKVKAIHGKIKMKKLAKDALKSAKEVKNSTNKITEVIAKKQAKTATLKHMKKNIALAGLGTAISAASIHHIAKRNNK